MIKNKLIELPILILKNIVIMPKNIIPIVVGKESSLKSINEALLKKNSRKICILFEKENNNGDIDYNQIDKIGIIANIIQTSDMSNGNIKVLLEGVSRIEIESFDYKNDSIYGMFKIKNTKISYSNIELEGLWRSFIKIYNNYSSNNKIKNEISLNDFDLSDIEVILDTIISQMPLKFDDKKHLLKENTLESRILYLINIIKIEREIFDIEEKINNNINNQIESSQKEFYLREQIKAIRKELNKENNEESLDELRKKGKDLGMLNEVYERLDKEIQRLESMQEYSSESSISRNYIDWLLSLPWSKQSIDNIEIEEASKILNKNHYGLEKIKESILEIIAAKKYAKENIRNPIICLVGPPGVGKTSLCKSIAESFNREFIRISLGGMKDEAEIKGHRKTYVGAMPGKIIQGMKRASTINPLILLDEIDKIRSDLASDPASCLLEILDYEQNNSFIDSYIDLPYDLSKVIFIGTANNIENIPYPLLDRMEIINISGYTLSEKMNITKSFIIPKHLLEHNLNSDIVEIDDLAINTIINEYTKESGVRQLERYIIKILRKTICKILKNENKNKKYIIKKNEILEYFKAPIFKIKKNIHKKRIGIATGLAWTELGGDVLEIEVAITSGKGNITLTGQLGEVMQESAQAAFTYLKTKMKEFGINKSKFQQYDIHIHVPEGGTPKDGPSAGITICAALTSKFCNIPILEKVAMTGEITLQGRILAIGGLKEKLLAAIMYDFETVIVPSENKDNCLDILNELGKISLNVVYVDNMDEVLKYSLAKNVFELIKKEKKDTKKKKILRKKKYD